jgi:2-amino-4-hydroxy-6-hydroxymethyldihydropteridine diphosphokinase
MNDAANAFVGIGSNLGDRLAILRAAVSELDGLARTHVVATSGIYEARALVPVDGAAQPDYLNAAVQLATERDPFELLAELLAIEQRHGRVRTARWTARTLDMDLLAYVPLAGSQSIEVDANGLVLPHPRAGDRDFVLAPLAELAPSIEIAGRSVAQRLAALPDSERTVVRRIAEPLRARDAILPRAGG